MGNGGLETGMNPFSRLPSPFGFYINERDYEAIRMIGILRESEATKDTATQGWNGQYTFSIFEAANVRGARN